MIRRFLPAMLITVASVLSFGQSGFAQSDNFVVYATKTTPFLNPWRVELRGQFDRRPVAASLIHLTGFANAVSIDGSSIHDPKRHFHVYQIESSQESKRQVSMTNELGKQTLTLGQPVSLLVPARAQLSTKSKLSSDTLDALRPESRILNHYKCYTVLKGMPLSKTVRLSDTFVGEAWRTRIERPLFFCVPVEKHRDERIHQIGDSKTHYTIYAISEHTLDQPKNVRWRDQFFQGTFTMSKSYLLCVPSQKEKWQQLN